MSRMLMMVAVVAVAGMFSVTSAEAATYCVDAPPGCVGVPFSPPKLERAVELAAASADDDVIQLGAATYGNTDNLLVPQTALGTLLIQGQGATTVFGNGSVRPQILDADATLRAVAVNAPATGAGVIVTRGTADAISVTGAGTGVTGVRLGEGGRLTNSTVTLTGLGSMAAQTTSGDGSVADSVLSACTGVLGQGAGTTTVQRSRVTAATGFDAVLGGLFVDTSTFRFGGPCAANAAVSMQGAATAPRNVRVTNLTAVGSSEVGSAGIELRRDSGAEAMSAEILSSVFTGFESTLVRTAAAGEPPTAQISASAIDEAQATTAGYVAGAEPNLDNPVLGFADPVTGDFRLTHASELVDRGEATGPLGASATDLAANAREIEGKPAVNGTAPRRDIGAFEYVPGLPTVTAGVAPPTSEAGAPMTFDATGDPGDAGEAITYEWAFDDGTTATGQSAEKVFATAGEHTATVTATDAAGWTATDGVVVTITEPPPPPPDPPAPPDPEPPAGGGTTTTTTTASGASSSFSQAVVTAPRPPSVVFTRRSAAVDARGRVGIRLLCRATDRPCVGRLTLTTVRRVRGRNRTVKLGAALYTIQPGEIGTIRVRVNRTRLPLLRGEGLLAVRGAATVAGGRPAQAELSVQRRPRR